MLGYLIIGLALILFVQAENIYPQLLLGRLLFSLGAAAASTMVTAVLPAVSLQAAVHDIKDALTTAPTDRTHTSSPSVTSEITITPATYRTKPNGHSASSAVQSSYSSTSRVAGFVGMLTGCGALIALLVFLPLPAFLQDQGMTPEHALEHSFYVVAAVAFFLAIWCFIGLRKLRSEERSVTSPQPKMKLSEQIKDTWANLKQAVAAGFRHSDIALGYTGGFVARASSVGVSLFIPLLVNALFLSSDLCNEESVFETPGGLPDIKRECPKAYRVAAMMTGVCETMALIAAPAFGYASSRTKRRGLPMMVASLAGVIGYPLFATQFDPDPAEHGKRTLALIAVSLIGVSQIGAIVCSLGILSNGILSHTAEGVADGVQDAGDQEREALLPSQQNGPAGKNLSSLKGSVAGIYSFYGGLAILVLTKVGGLLFDKVSVGAPFYIMAGFNGVLFLVCAALGTRVQE